MAFALTKKEQTDRDTVVQQLRAAQAGVEDAVAVAEDAIAHLINVYNDTLATYNAAMADAELFTDDVLSRLEEEWDTRSEAWRASPEGYDAQTFLAEWQALDFLEFDAHPHILLTDEDLEHADVLAQAPTRADA